MLKLFVVSTGHARVGRALDFARRHGAHARAAARAEQADGLPVHELAADRGRRRRRHAGERRATSRVAIIMMIAAASDERVVAAGVRDRRLVHGPGRRDADDGEEDGEKLEREGDEHGALVLHPRVGSPRADTRRPPDL